MADSTGGKKTKKLSFWDCMSFCIGQIIGSGIMVLTGIVIGLTGHGTPYAFIGAAVLALLTMVPSVILAATIPASGASYTYLTRVIGPRSGFFYLCMFVITQVLIATFAQGFASYFMSMFPALQGSIINAKTVAIFVVLLAAVINLIGLKTSALVQKGMVVLLLVSLFLFCAFGLPKVNWAVFTPSVQTIMPNGVGNFLMGIALLSFATGGAKFIAENADEVENPSRNIPLAMIISTLLVAVFYAFIGIVASGVLPLAQVAGENLTQVAKTIFPPWLYVFFVVGGAMFALLTTLNSTLSWVTRGLQASAKEGWLPPIFAKENKGGTPVVLLLLFTAVGVLPIAFNMDTTSIANMGIGLDMLCEFFVLLACFRLPSKFPKEYNKAPFTMKRPLLYVVLSIVGILMLGTSYVNLSDLNWPVYIVIAVYLVFIFVLTQLRYKYVKKKTEAP